MNNRKVVAILAAVMAGVMILSFMLSIFANIL